MSTSSRFDSHKSWQSRGEKRTISSVHQDNKYENMSRVKEAILSSFRVVPKNQFDPRINENRITAPPFQQPVQLCTFSYDGNRNLVHDDSQMKWYYPPILDGVSRQTDLSYGFEKFIKRDESVPEHIDALLDAIMRHGDLSPGPIKADIVTWRGIITKFLTTPYTRNEPWSLNAMVLDNALYIEEDSKPDKQSYGQTSRDQIMTFWGYKFEALCTLPTRPISDKLAKDDLMERIESTVNTNEQWCSVVRTKLGRSRLLIGGEVDCVMDHQKSPVRVELKTSKVIQNARDETSFERHKLLKYWAQSFLLDVPIIIVGFRDQEGFIKTLQQFKTLEIPRLVRDKPGLWDPNVCLVFAERLLHCIRSVILEHSTENPNCIYRIEWKTPWMEVTIRVLDKEELKTEITDNRDLGETVEKIDQTRWGFLPQRYYDWKQKRLYNDAQKQGMI